jgi:formylglycine-generating enzyme required for sulfatase activity
MRLCATSLAALALIVGTWTGPKARPGKREEVANSLRMRLVLVPAGRFLMGSPESSARLSKAYPAYGFESRPGYFDDERPRHPVEITRPFYLGAHEVTVGQFRQFVKASGYRTEAEKDGEGGWGVNVRTGTFEGRKPKYSWRNPGFPQTDRHPVVNVTWNDAVAFCRWLGKREGKRYRLPTEAEWEYACRAGTTTRYHSGDDPETLVKVANVADAAGGKQGRRQFPNWDRLALKGSDGQVYTAPVGSYRPNAWGLFDMHGNVWEWCSDYYDEDYYGKSPVKDPEGPEEGHLRARRGGAWHTFPLFARSSFRNYNTPVSRYLNLGFRVARDR